MNKTDILKQMALNFFMIHCGINAAIGLIGSLYAQDQCIPYSAMFSPMIYAFFCVLPTLITYSAKEMSITNLLVRKLLEFLLIMGIVVVLTYSSGLWTSPLIVGAIMLSVVVVYGVVCGLDYLICNTKARAMNRLLKQAQAHYEAKG